MDRWLLPKYEPSTSSSRSWGFRGGLYGMREQETLNAELKPCHELWPMPCGPRPFSLDTRIDDNCASMKALMQNVLSPYANFTTSLTAYANPLVVLAVLEHPHRSSVCFTYYW